MRPPKMKQTTLANTGICAPYKCHDTYPSINAARSRMAPLLLRSTKRAGKDIALSREVPDLDGHIMVIRGLFRLCTPRREFQQDVIGWGASRIRLYWRPHSARHTPGDRMAAHPRLALWRGFTS